MQVADQPRARDKRSTILKTGAILIANMLAHEKLHVYGKALDLAARMEEWLSGWDKKHALVDQLSRATESILLNLAEAARQRDAPGRFDDY